MNEYAVVKVQAKGELSKRMPFTYRPENRGVSPLFRLRKCLMAPSFQSANLPDG